MASDNDEGRPMGIKPKVVSITKKQKKPSVAERALEQLPELEAYLKGVGKDTKFLVVFSDDMRFLFGVDSPSEFIGILEFEKYDYLNQLEESIDE